MAILLSVVVPAHNAALTMPLLLESFQQQTRGRDEWELIVVDDASTDGTYDVVQSFGAEYELRCIKSSCRGRAAARNAGADNARGEYLVFCDADRLADTLFLETHAQHAEKKGGVVIGAVREVYLRQLPQYSGLLTDDLRGGCAFLRRRSRMPRYVKTVLSMYRPTGECMSSIPWVSCFSGNMSLGKALFLECGGFNKDFAEWGFEHFELGYRLWRQGTTFTYEHLAVNYHLAHPRRAGFYKNAVLTSHQQFAELHPAPEVGSFLPFLRGEISLECLNDIAGGMPLPQKGGGTYYRDVVDCFGDPRKPRK